MKDGRGPFAVSSPLQVSLTPVKPVAYPEVTTYEGQALMSIIPDPEPYTGNEGRFEHEGPAGADGPGPYWQRAAEGSTYGFCDYCHCWTYADRWHGSCGECRWRWSHYPGTLPTELQPYRDAMPPVHSAESCYGTSCELYGSLS